MSAAAADPTRPWRSFEGGRKQLHLVGFMGVGKSTVARLLARRMLWNFLDLDAVVVRYMGRPVEEIFAVDGEAAFRDAESHALRQTALKPCTVVALGGGSWERPENRDLSRRRAVSVWLDCPFELLRRRIGEQDAAARPLWREPEELAALFEARRTRYADAELRVDAAPEPERVAARVIEALSGSFAQ